MGTFTRELAQIRVIITVVINIIDIIIIIIDIMKRATAYSTRNRHDDVDRIHKQFDTHREVVLGQRSIANVLNKSKPHEHSYKLEYGCKGSIG